MLDPGRGRTKTGQLWAYARDDRPWGGTDPPGVAYVYAPDRKAERPIAHLAGFQGVLQVDGYGGYKVLAERGEVRLAFCWAMSAAASTNWPRPARRRSPRRRSSASRRSTGSRARSAAARPRSGGRSARSAAAPLVEALEPWLREKLALISQKSKLAEAIRYALSRWAGLALFLDDGRVEIDSNVVERAIRPLALTRKNALFAGSDGGAEHWAVIASLIETCKLIGVEPQAYLADVITRIVDGHPQQPPRRAPALGLPAHTRSQSRGLRTPLTVFPFPRLNVRYQSLEFGSPRVLVGRNPDWLLGPMVAEKETFRIAPPLAVPGQSEPSRKRPSVPMLACYRTATSNAAGFRGAFRWALTAGGQR